MLTDSCYEYMFYGCILLVLAPELPATTLASYCCHKMLYKCTSLTTAHALSVITLVDDCYWNMFNGRTNIKLSTTQTEDYQTPYRIHTSETGITADNALLDMFTNTSGAFTDTPEINTTYYTSNTVV